MKIIKKEIEKTQYPVGEFIIDNLFAINSMGEAIFSFLKKRKINKNTIILLWCRGSSGSIIASLISKKLYEKKYKRVVINHVKKEGENAHNNGITYYSGINIIVDDFIVSGETIFSIIKKIKRFKDNKIDCICVTGYVGNSIIKKLEHENVCYLIH